MTYKPNNLIAPLIGSLLLLSGFFHAESFAQGTAAYELRVSTESKLLADPDDGMAQMAAVWKTPLELQVLRSMPVFQLKNTSTGSINISELSIDINEAGYTFDSVKILESSPGITPTTIDPADSVFGGATSKIANFSFGTRMLKPEECFHFSLRIVPSAGMPPSATDYRKILWGKPGEDRNDNALVKVKFGGMGDLSSSLFNYTNTDAYINSEKDNSSGRSMRIPGMSHFGTEAGLYEMNQLSVVPEPSSLLLAMLGFGALVTTGGRRRLRTALFCS